MYVLCRHVWVLVKENVHLCFPFLQAALQKAVFGFLSRFLGISEVPLLFSHRCRRAPSGYDHLPASTLSFIPASLDGFLPDRRMLVEVDKRMLTIGVCVLLV